MNEFETALNVTDNKGFSKLKLQCWKNSHERWRSQCADGLRSFVWWRKWKKI